MKTNISIVLVAVLSFFAITVSAQSTVKTFHAPTLNAPKHDGCFYATIKNGKAIRENCYGLYLRAGVGTALQNGSFLYDIEGGWAFKHIKGIEPRFRVGVHAGSQKTELESLKYDASRAGARLYLDLNPHSKFNFFIGAGVNYIRFNVIDEPKIKEINPDSPDTGSIQIRDNAHTTEFEVTAGISTRIARNVHILGQYTHGFATIETPIRKIDLKTPAVKLALEVRF